MIRGPRAQGVVLDDDDASALDIGSEALEAAQMPKWRAKRYRGSRPEEITETEGPNEFPAL